MLLSFRLWHKQQTDVLEVHWYVTGSLHGCSAATSRPFASFEAHKDFQHILLPPKAGCTNKMILMEMRMELIEAIVVYNDKNIKNISVHSRIRSYKSGGEVVWDFSGDKWSSMKSKINWYSKTTQKIIKRTQGA